MVTAQDDLMLVVAENARLEFAGYGHDGPFGSCGAASKDWYAEFRSLALLLRKFIGGMSAAGESRLPGKHNQIREHGLHCTGNVGIAAGRPLASTSAGRYRDTLSEIFGHQITAPIRLRSC